MCNVKHGADLDKMMKALVRKGCRLGEPELKRVPSGYEADPAHAHLLQYKNLAAWLDTKGHAKATGGDAVKQAVAAFATLRPVHDFLMSL